MFKQMRHLHVDWQVYFINAPSKYGTFFIGVVACTDISETMFTRYIQDSMHKINRTNTVSLKRKYDYQILFWSPAVPEIVILTTTYATSDG